MAGGRGGREPRTPAVHVLHDAELRSWTGDLSVRTGVQRRNAA